MAEPILETSRLILRNYQRDDWEYVHQYAKEPSFSQYEMWGPNSEADTKNFITLMLEQAKQNPRWQFDCAVTLKSNRLLVGGCGIRRESPESSIANLGWAIHPAFQNRGYASEAAEKLIQFGFQQLGLSLIYATCDARNKASQRVMEKLGLRYVSTKIADKMQKGVLRDTMRFEKMNPAYKAS